MGGQQFTEVAVQVRWVGVGAAALQAGDEPAVVGDGDGDRVRDAGVLEQRGLDLAEFEPVSAEFDLCVLPPGVVQQALCVEARQVAGAVEGAAVGTGGEAVTVESGITEVARGGHGAADEETARDTGWDGVVLRVHDMQFGVRDRAADGGPGRPGGRVAAQAQAADHMGLGGAVVVEQAGVVEPGEPLADGVGADQLLPAVTTSRSRAGNRPLRTACSARSCSAT